MKKFIVVISFLAVLFFSCKDGNNTDSTDPIDDKSVTKKTFYIQNFKTEGVFDSVEAGLLAEGTNCHIWAGRDTNISKEKAENMAKIFDDDIYFKMMYYFSFTKEDGVKYDGEKVDTTMDIVKLLVNGDGKLNIVLADIKDNYQPGVNNAYIGGYFWNGDLFERDAKDPYLRYSNECAVIFIDTYPSVPGSEESNSTLAHEMQHLMNYLNSLVCRGGHEFDVWIDEGLSLSAEYLYLEKHITARVNHYRNDPSGLICKGNNFFIWDNRKDESPYAGLDDYATDYLFFQWLRTQTNPDDPEIYSYIMFSNSYDQNAVVKAYNAYNEDNDISAINLSWDSLLKAWMASNQIKAAKGLYGYNGELSDIKAHAAPSSQTSIQLYPGEGVYSKASSQPNTSGSGTNIKYAYITTTDVKDSYLANSTLLTYNGSINTKGSSEKGIITGAASEQVVPNARFISSLHNEPLQIDARDMRGRDKWRASYSNGIAGLSKGVKDE